MAKVHSGNHFKTKQYIIKYILFMSEYVLYSTGLVHLIKRSTVGGPPILDFSDRNIRRSETQWSLSNRRISETSGRK